MEDFTSNNNKGLLWNLLYEQKIFAAIPDAHVKQIKYIFDKEISNISQGNQDQKTTLMELNKHAIQIVTGRVQMYKQENSNFYDKKKEIELSLNKKQLEFDTLMNKAVPEAPEFTDQKDEPFNNNSMEELLNDMISAREKQLNQVLTLESDKKPDKEDKTKEDKTKEDKTKEDRRDYQKQELFNQNFNKTSTPIIRIGSNLSLADETVMDISRISNNIDIPGATNTDTKMERNVSFTDDDFNKPNKFLQNLKRVGINKIMNEDFTGEQKFNEHSKLDAISYQLTALMEKVSSIERTMEHRDSMSSRSSFGSISLSPPK